MKTSSSIRALVALCVSLALSACGGGGGGSDAAAKPSSTSERAGAAPFGATYTTRSIEVSTVEGISADAVFEVTLDDQPDEPVWLLSDETGALVKTGENIGGDAAYRVSVQLSDGLPAGSYDSEVVTHICSDEHCVHEYEGSPIRLPIRYVVKPNIHVQSAVVLTRSGQEPAPSSDIAVDVPLEAGTVSAALTTGSPDAVNVSFDGSKLHVNTAQVRAGSYTGTVVLSSATDSRYRRTVDISYKVIAPEGGEKALSANLNSADLNVEQGKSASVRIKATRPTWTGDWGTPTLLGTAGPFSLKDLGNDEFEVTANAAGLPQGAYHTTLQFSAGTTGGSLYIPVSVSVSSSFRIGQGLSMTQVDVTDTSTEATLSQSVPITTYDGVASTWSAVSLSPWLSLTKSSGTTGVDALQFQVVKTHLQEFAEGESATIQITVNRPNTLPQSYKVWLNNGLSTLQSAASGTLVGSKGRVYLSGRFSPFTNVTQWLESGKLKVSGAVVEKAALVFDPRMLGNDGRLMIDVREAQAGRPITVTLSNALLTSQVQLSVVSAEAAPVGYVPLPYGAYRPPEYVPALNSLYWAGAKQMFRWTHDGHAWQLAQTTLEGLVDIAVRSDEAILYAAVGREVFAYDPRTLAFLRKDAFPLDLDRLVDDAFDAEAPTSGRAFAYMADGRAFASLVARSSSPAGDRGVAWIAGAPDSSLANDLSASPAVAEPGNRKRTLATGSTIVRSAGGRSLVAVDADGLVWSSSADRHGEWSNVTMLPAGTQIAAINDAGTLYVRTDGVLQSFYGTPGYSLSAYLPPTHVPGGFGLTADGRIALIYGYRVETDSSTGRQRARDAAIWALDLSNGMPSGAAALPVLGSVALPDAVGCTGTPDVGEACLHRASLTIDAAGKSVFVLGPRGVAAVSLPTAWTTELAASGFVSTSSSSGSARIKALSATSVRPQAIKPVRLFPH